MRSGGLSRLPTQIPCDQVDEQVGAARDLVQRAGSARVRRARALAQLGLVLAVRFQCRTDPADLTESIEVMRTAIGLMPRQAAERDQVESCLAIALCTRRGPGDVPEAIGMLRRINAGDRPVSLERAWTLAQLGFTLMAGWTLTNKAADAAEAVAVLETALAGAPPPDSRVRRAVVGVLRLGLAGALAGVAHAGAGVDRAVGERVTALLDGIDVDLLEEMSPGTAEWIDRIAMTVRGFAGFARGGRLELSHTSGHPTPEPGSLLGGVLRVLGGTSERMEGLQTFGERGELRYLDDQVAALRAELDASDPLEAFPGLQLVILAGLLLMRSRNLRMSGRPEAQRDLAEALELATRVAADDDPVTLRTALLYQGQSLLDRWLAGFGSRSDLDDALMLLHRGAALEEPNSQAALSAQLPIVEVLAARAMRDGDLDDLDDAETLLRTLRERMVAGSATVPIMAVRLAALRMLRAAGTGDTEDILRASLEIRSATDEVAEVSLLWEYDAAAMWARWTRESAPLPEQADAHQRAVVALYRLAGVQLTRNYSELALRRLSAGLAAHAAYALARTDRAADAAVAAETGRAVLLALALETKRPPLPDTVDQGLRDRFAAAAARLARAETDVLNDASARPIGAEQLWPTPR